MNTLICLKVKYGFHVNALFGFLESQDYKCWEGYLKNFSNQVATSGKDGMIYWLLKRHTDIKEIRSKLSELPLLKEDFLEMQIFELAEFSGLDCLFNLDMVN